ncbi:DUF5011 domain-containing protein [Salicibibacter cibi]|uniref:DUF5011 domain-containing protein n=1 Tax=Salicibibacter cibi TaxID=2743001 RepID=A0A7T7CGN8_9BACI|nr:immunoglobulin-like domain-containing protein [Salicibibacter cibi]QQK81408.1 DUF5011 domain-containing protein [Salicibibacter cibi]
MEVNHSNIRNRKNRKKIAKRVSGLSLATTLAVGTALFSSQHDVGHAQSENIMDSDEALTEFHSNYNDEYDYTVHSLHNSGTGNIDYDDIDALTYIVQVPDELSHLLEDGSADRLTDPSDTLSFMVTGNVIEGDGEETTINRSEHQPGNFVDINPDTNTVAFDFYSFFEDNDLEPTESDAYQSYGFETPFTVDSENAIPIGEYEFETALVTGGNVDLDSVSGTETVTLSVDEGPEPEDPDDGTEDPVPEPEIDLLGEDPMEIDVGTDFEDVDPGVEATDEEDGDLTDAIDVDTSELDTSEPGEYTVTYSVENSGGESASVERDVIVIVIEDEDEDGEWVFDATGQIVTGVPGLEASEFVMNFGFDASNFTSEDVDSVNIEFDVPSDITVHEPDEYIEGEIPESLEDFFEEEGIEGFESLDIEWDGNTATIDLDTMASDEGYHGFFNGFGESNQALEELGDVTVTLFGDDDEEITQIDVPFEIVEFDGDVDEPVTPGNGGTENGDSADGEDGTGNGGSTDESDDTSGDSERTDDESADEVGGALPDTASNNPLMALIGLGIAALGAASIFVRKKLLTA